MSNAQQKGLNLTNASVQWLLLQIQDHKEKMSQVYDLPQKGKKIEGIITTKLH